MTGQFDQEHEYELSLIAAFAVAGTEARRVGPITRSRGPLHFHDRAHVGAETILLPSRREPGDADEDAE